METSKEKQRNAKIAAGEPTAYTPLGVTKKQKKISVTSNTNTGIAQQKMAKKKEMRDQNQKKEQAAIDGDVKNRVPPWTSLVDIVTPQYRVEVGEEEIKDKYKASAQLFEVFINIVAMRRDDIVTQEEIDKKLNLTNKVTQWGDFGEAEKANPDEY